MYITKLLSCSRNTAHLSGNLYMKVELKRQQEYGLAVCTLQMSSCCRHVVMLVYSPCLIHTLWLTKHEQRASQCILMHRNVKQFVLEGSLSQPLTIHPLMLFCSRTFHLQFHFQQYTRLFLDRHSTLTFK